MVPILYVLWLWIHGQVKRWEPMYLNIPAGKRAYIVILPRTAFASIPWITWKDWR